MKLLKTKPTQQLFLSCIISYLVCALKSIIGKSSYSEQDPSQEDHQTGGGGQGGSAALAHGILGRPETGGS